MYQYNSKGTKIQTYNFEDPAFGAELPGENDIIDIAGVIAEGGDTFFTLYGESSSYKKGIAILNLQEEDLQTKQVLGLKKLDDYQLVIEEFNGKINYSIMSSFINGQLILSNNYINEAFIYNHKEDTAFHRLYDSGITPNFVSKSESKKLSNFQEARQLMKEREEEVYFYSLVFDDVTDKYYRLSTTGISESSTDKKVVLTVFNKSFEMLHEQEVKDIPTFDAMGVYFFKDGKMYIYKNMEDELGFIRLSFSEK